MIFKYKSTSCKIKNTSEEIKAWVARLKARVEAPNHELNRKHTS